MRFLLDTEKAIQATALLIREDGMSRMNYMRLLKLLYIADRESLREIGHPIVGGRVAALERGPVLDDVYALIKAEHSDAPLWNRFFSRQRYDLVMDGDPGVDRMSRYDVEKLREVAFQYAGLDEWDMVNETHKLPEWIKHDPGKSSRPIPYEDILREVGQTDNISDIEQAVAAEAAIDSFFAKRKFRESGRLLPS